MKITTEESCKAGVRGKKRLNMVSNYEESKLLIEEVWHYLSLVQRQGGHVIFQESPSRL